MKEIGSADGQLRLFPDDEPFFRPVKSQQVNVGGASAEMVTVGKYAELFSRLAKSAFRSKFHLGVKDKAYVQQKGLDTIRHHAADFVSHRLAPAVIPNDGKQTPMRGHPVFLAQHATACCCRGCLSKWHHIPSGRPLTAAEQAYVVDVVMTWIDKECGLMGQRADKSGAASTFETGNQLP